MSGIFHALKYDEPTDLVVVESMQDVEPILKANAEARQNTDGWSPSRELRWVGQIPNILLMKWYAEENIDWRKEEDWLKLLAKLDDPENSALRIGAGKILSRPYREYPTTMGR